MAEANTVVETAKTDQVDTTTADGTKETTATTTTITSADDAVKTATTEAVKTDADAEKKPAWGDDWRDQMSAGDEDIAKAIARYGSPKGVAKALKEAQTTINSGKLKGPKPDAADEKAMAEWRKSEGIPDDPTGYVLPDTVKKRMTDEDKPMLASFTAYAHGKGGPQAAVDIASEWYFDTQEAALAERIQADDSAKEAAEEALRKDWAGGEYKANLMLATRYMADTPLGQGWAEARLPDGRRIGDIPEFVAWASDMGRERYGDVAFASADTASRHGDRKAEIETIMKTDMPRYYSEGLDKEYTEILEREEKRRK